MSPLDIDLANPALDDTTIPPPPASTCGECDQTRAAARLFEFAAAQLRARVTDLEHALALALELLDRVPEFHPTVVFEDEVPAGEDRFGFLDAPTLVRVLEVAPDPFAGAAAGVSSGGASGCFAACAADRCDDVIFDGSGHTCDRTRGHAGAHVATGADGRPVIAWGRSRI